MKEFFWWDANRVECTTQHRSATIKIIYFVIWFCLSPFLFSNIYFAISIRISRRTKKKVSNTRIGNHGQIESRWTRTPNWKLEFSINLFLLFGLLILLLLWLLRLRQHKYDFCEYLSMSRIPAQIAWHTVDNVIHRYFHSAVRNAKIHLFDSNRSCVVTLSRLATGDEGKNQF